MAGPVVEHCHVPADQRHVLHQPRRLDDGVERRCQCGMLKPISAAPLSGWRSTCARSSPLPDSARKTLPSRDVDLGQQIALAPVIVGHVVPGGNLPAGAKHLRARLIRRV